MGADKIDEITLTHVVGAAVTVSQAMQHVEEAWRVFCDGVQATTGVEAAATPRAVDRLTDVYDLLQDAYRRLEAMDALIRNRA